MENKPSFENHARPLISALVRKTILDAAMKGLDHLNNGQSDISHVEKLVDDIWALLPPIASDSSLEKLAESVLTGNSNANVEFGARLRELSTWNTQYARCHAESLPEAYHKKLLSLEFLDGLVKAYPHNKKSNSTIDPLLIARLIGAAVLNGQGSAKKINTNVEIITTQIRALYPLLSLKERATRVLESNRFLESFVASLYFYSGRRTPTSGIANFDGDFGGGPDDRPYLPGFGGQPFVPGQPFDGGFVWPPNPGGGGAPGMPLPFPPPIPEDPTLVGGLECLPEFLRAFVDIIGPALGRLNYRFDSISPLDACVGETITITGSGFLFEGADVRVRFQGANFGPAVVSAAIRPISGTQIEVVVPPGATCGTIELTLDEPLTVLACDVTLTLNLTTSSTIEFLGGETTTSLGFRHPRRRGCMLPGEVININHVSCNAELLTLRISSDDPAVEDFVRSYSASIPRATSYTFPTPTRETAILVEATVTGRCGTDSRTLTIMLDQARPIAPAGPAIFTPGRFRNWNHNIDRPIMQFAPTNREDLINAVLAAEASGRRLAIAGSGFSFSECAVPEESDYVLLDTIYLNEILELPIADIISDRAQTILSTDNINMYSEVLEGGALSPLSERLVYVEGGIKLVHLNDKLDALNLALPTMGGGDSQSLVGAFSTGTHGSTVDLPPVADFVRAIHLVGSQGKEWWIESSSRRITDPDQMELQRGELFSLCTNIIYDDNLFNATLVSLGSAGVIYAVVYETVDAHRMCLEIVHTTWSTAQNWMLENILGSTRDEDHWFIELLVLADGKTYITTNDLTELPINIPVDEGLSDLALAALLANILPGALGLTGGLIGLLLAYIPAEIGRMLIYYSTFQFSRGNQSRENLSAVFGIIGSVRYILRLLNDETQEETLFEIIPGVINDIWKLGDIIPVGREIVDLIVSQIAGGRRPENPKEPNPIVLKSFDALRLDLKNEEKRAELAIERAGEEIEGHLYPPLPIGGSNWGNDRASDDPHAHSTQWKNSPGFERLVESHEYIVRPDQLIGFIDGLLNIANEIRNRRTSTALVLALPIRFTKRSVATLAMQRHDLSCHVELFVMERLDGTEEFLTRAREFARTVNAIPHWGQLHDETRNFEDVYGAGRIRGFRNQMVIIADGEPNTFRNEFSVTRNLLSR